MFRSAPEGRNWGLLDSALRWRAASLGGQGGFPFYFSADALVPAEEDIPDKIPLLVIPLILLGYPIGRWKFWAEKDMVGLVSRSIRR